MEIVDCAFNGGEISDDLLRAKGPKNGQQKSSCEKEAKTLDKSEKNQDGVTLSVSHVGLAVGLKPVSSNEAQDQIRIGSSFIEPKKNKERPMKDITTKVDLRPISLKPKSGGKYLVNN